MIVVTKIYKKLIIDPFRDKIMIRYYNDDKIQEILKEEPELCDELNSILNSMREYLANFDHQESSRLFVEYLRFYDMLRIMTNIPKNLKTPSLNKIRPWQINIYHLNIEDNKAAEIFALLYLKLDTIERRIRDRIQYLRENNGDLIIRTFLEHQINILRQSKFRERISSIRYTMKKYTQVRNDP